MSAPLSDRYPLRPEDLRLVADRFEGARRDQGLTRKELVREAGYENIAKGLRRLDHVESDDPPAPDERVLRRFADALDVDLEALGRRIDEHRRARRRAELERHPVVLGTLVRRARERLGQSRERVADDSAVSARRLRAIECGDTRFPTDRELESLCDALELDDERAEQARTKEFRYYDRLDGRADVRGRPAPGVLISIDVPEELSTEDIVAFATEYATDRGIRARVALPDGRTIHVRSDGWRFESP